MAGGGQAGTVRALVTNDDGIDSPGLLALARGAVAHGWAVVVAAPAGQASGTGASLAATADHGRVRVERRELPGLPDVPAHALAAHPGFIALVAAQGAFGAPPDVVLSGVNPGANTGRAVLHSGTVGAALTAAVNGARALAVSLDLALDPDVPVHWDTAVAVAATLFDRVAALPAGAVLNLNVPNLAEVGRVRRAGLAGFGSVWTGVEDAGAGTIPLVAFLADDPPAPGTDVALLAAGVPTVTPLRSVTEDGGVEVWP